MKNKVLGLLIACFLLLSLVSCADSETADLSEEQANAYFTVFESLYEDDPGLNDGTYLAVDLTNVKLTDTTPLIVLIQTFCDDNEYTLLQDTFEGLTEKGYITDLYFKDGLLISFDDTTLEESKLVTSAQKWRSGTGAIGADFTVEQEDNLWEITKTSSSWIS